MEILEILKIFWFFLPAGIANMSPVLFKWLNFLNYPVDFGKKLNKKPILGKNKTFRGLITGVLMSIIFTYIQILLYPNTKYISLINYSETNFIFLGFLLGFGALFGDLTKSFFKRQLNIKPGKSWIIFDQLDWIIGAIVFTIFYIKLSVAQILIAIILFGILHPIVNLIGYLIKIKKNKF
jgi:CDP-2,3-bis-(O-geranylgeranyl)-sn-glycerol synthase